MLVLSRKVQEEIVIGDAIRVVVLKVEGNRVRLGIEAPEGVKLLRGELVSAEAPALPRTPPTNAGQSNTPAAAPQ